MDASEVRHAARQVGEHDAVTGAARAGYAVNGVLHLLIGWIALQVAWGLTSGASAADQSGALGTLASSGLGRVILWIGVVGYLGLGFWQLGQSLARHAEAKDRLKSAGKGIVYLALAGTAFVFAKGDSTSSSKQSSDVTANLMSKPFGTGLVVLVGAALVGVGVYHVVKGWKKKFLRDLVEHPGTAVEGLARFGYIAKGIALGIVGVLFWVAALNNDPNQATGLDGALKSLLAVPYGKALLTLIALGFVAYGIYSFVRAKKARV